MFSLSSGLFKAVLSCSTVHRERKDPLFRSSRVQDPAEQAIPSDKAGRFPGIRILSGKTAVQPLPLISKAAETDLHPGLLILSEYPEGLQGSITAQPGKTEAKRNVLQDRVQVWAAESLS